MILRRLLVSLLVVSACSHAQDAPKRPAITGISFIRFYETDMAASTAFFHDGLGLPTALKRPGSASFAVNPYQSIQIVALPAIDPGNRLASVGYRTADVKALKLYLDANGVKSELHPGPSLKVQSPAGTEVWFVADKPSPARPASASSDSTGPKQGSTRIIHTGWVVHDREAEAHFFQDILGFRPYWFGWPDNQPVSYVSMQVPDGHDWVEFMLRPAGNSIFQLGGPNHVSLGVENIDEAAAIVLKNGLPADKVKTNLGRDGKWQMNLYDPEHSRIEFMEFSPRGTTCCSPFTAEHPSANDAHK